MPLGALPVRLHYLCILSVCSPSAYTNESGPRLPDPFLVCRAFGLSNLQPGAGANRACGGATGRITQPGASEHLPAGRSTQPGALKCQPGVLHNRALDRNRA